MPDTSHLSQVGKFDLPVDLLHESPEVMSTVLSTVIVVRCEMIFSTKSFAYEAISPDFEAVPEGEEVPHYDVSYDEETEAVTWTKRSS